MPIGLSLVRFSPGSALSRRGVLLRYSPDQPRDELGRWTDEGGGDGGDGAGAVAAAATQLGDKHGQEKGSGAGSGAGGPGGARSPDEAQGRATAAAAGYAKLKDLPDKPLKVGDRYLVPGPFGRAKIAAAKYMRDAGLPYDPPAQYLKVDKERAARIATAFDQMKHDPDSPAVQASYEALANETVAQWHAIKDTGLKVEWIKEGQPDPYAASPRLAAMDVIDNNHWWGFPTDAGFGSGKEAEAARHNNPMLKMTDEVVDGRRLMVNDVFRIVHDYFGHFKDGNGFRADGEENAWRSHSAMYSELARGAMTSETRGQNSWVNFGPYGESNRTASAADTHYAPQKIGLMPEWTWNEGRKDPRGMHPGHGYSQEAYVQDGKIHTSNVADAARALYEGRQVVLNQPREVATLLEHLGRVAKIMIARGEKAPNFNLCNVSVEGTNLFCAESKGIPRVEMPQLDEQQTKDFIPYLQAKGYAVKETTEHVAYLRATQNELNGAKVAGIAAALQAGKVQSKRIIVSRDNYILDGHHNWAAKIGLDAKNNVLGKENMDVLRVDIGIIDLLKEAETFTGGKGHKTVGQMMLRPVLVRYLRDAISGATQPHDPATGEFEGDGGGGSSVGNVVVESHPAATLHKEKKTAVEKTTAKAAAGKAAKPAAEPLNLPAATPKKFLTLTANTIKAEAPEIKARSRAVPVVAKEVNARAQGIWKTMGVKSGKVEEPNPTTDGIIRDIFVQEIKDGLFNGHAHADWYSDKMKEAMRIATLIHPDIAKNPKLKFAFIAALAITSQGEKVNNNAALTEKVYAAFEKSGRFPTDVEAIHQKSINGNFTKLNSLLDKFDGDAGKVVAWLNGTTTVKTLADAGFKISNMKMGAEVYRSAIFGPKIGEGFYQNIQGNFKPLTVDMWFMRTWGRITGTGIGSISPELDKTQTERLTNALAAAKENVPKSKNGLLTKAREIERATTQRYVKANKEGTTAKEKTELEAAAQRYVLARDDGMVDMATAGQREWITKVFLSALAKLKTEGIDITPAAAQATTWNPEKVMYERLGARTPAEADYAAALKAIAKSKGIAV
jgi:hypothetical protein